MFKGVDRKSFHRKFATNDDCREYLYQLKWGKGYKCRKCGCTSAVKGSTPYHKRCKACSYNESPLARTAFQNMKLPLLTAFQMAFRIIMCKKGVSCLALASDYNVRVYTAWAFKRKLQAYMLKHLQIPSYDDVMVKLYKMDGINISFRGDGLNGLQQVHLLIRSRKNGEFGLVAAGENYNLPSKDELTPSDLFQGHYIAEGKRLKIYHLKNWITGTHHHCSIRYLEGYVAEYLFRYNNRNCRKELWHNLISVLVPAETCT